MSVVLILIIIFLAILIAALFIVSPKIEEKLKELRRITNDVELRNEEVQALEEKKFHLTEDLNKIDNDIKIATIKREKAIDLAEKDIELEVEKRRREFEKQLEQDFEKLKEEHPIDKYQKDIDDLCAKITEYRKSLLILQAQEREKEEQADFNAAHSIHLAILDKADIELIRKFATELRHKEAFYKVIWSEYYQKPLQTLRKALGADKKTGIYKITNVKNNKCYIGQALNIGDRWAEHVKSSLGLMSTTYMLNKFYREMSEIGPESFSFEIVEECEVASLTERERYWIDYYNSIEYGYNTK